MKLRTRFLILISILAIGGSAVAGGLSGGLFGGDKVACKNSTPMTIGDRYFSITAADGGSDDPFDPDQSTPFTVKANSRTFTAYDSGTKLNSTPMTIGDRYFDLKADDGGDNDPWEGRELPATFPIEIGNRSFTGTK